MTALDLTRLKELAQKAQGNPWPFNEKAFRALATPAAVLGLFARLDVADAIAESLTEQVDCLTTQRDELKARAEHAEAIVNGTLPAMTQCPACFTVHDPRLGQPDPNDPLDDVLPLAKPAAAPAWVDATFPLDDASRHWPQAKPLPLNLPASLDVADSEGGHHD